jgi:hypothetical protein
MSSAAWKRSGLGTAGLRIDIAFVSSKTGEVLGLVRFNPLFGRQETEDKLANGFAEALHDLPLPMPPPKH